MNGNLVLIFDKRIEISNKYKKILEHNHSSQVVIASDKIDFFNKITTFEPDMILISESVSENLSELSKEIRLLNLQFRPVIVLLSKSSYNEDKTNALNAGADDFLSEPINSDEFLARINAHLRRTIEENSDSQTKFPTSVYTEKIIRRTIKNHHNWAMLLIGIDNFSFYGEIYGELATNKLLQAFSAILNASVEYDDFVGQLTNDTFLIVTSSFKAEKLADYINYAFDTVVKRFYSDEDASREYILLNGANKAGCKIPLMAVSIGIINSELINYIDEIEATNALNKVQKLAKTLSGSAKVIDRPLIASEEKVNFIDEKSIVVIEQDEDLAYLLETSLKIQGFNPFIYNKYDITVDEILNHSPSIILIDSGKNDSTLGLKLCKEIKQTSIQNIKIIFTDTTHEKEQILSAGADLYLPKPYDLMDLFQWIYRISD